MGCEKMLQIKVVVFKKLYKFYTKHFLIIIIVNDIFEESLANTGWQTKYLQRYLLLIDLIVNKFYNKCMKMM